MGDEAWDEYEEHKMEKWEGSPSSDDFSPNISRFGKRFAKIKMADIQLETSGDPTPVRSPSPSLSPLSLSFVQGLDS
jgi:hypothetical protein